LRKSYVVERRWDFVKQLEIRSYRDLKVWERAILLSQSCYELTAKFPVSERYGMTTQIRRAATSVPANIAKGHGRQSTGSFVQFLENASGSINEVETLLMLAQRVRLTSPERVNPLLSDCDEIGKMLRGLVRSLRSSGVTIN